MATDRIRIATNRLNGDKATVEKTSKTLKNKVEIVKSSVKSLNEMWDGEGHDAFEKAFKADIKIVEAAFKELDVFVKYEGKAVTEYEKCEKKVSSLINSIKI